MDGDFVSKGKMRAIWSMPRDGLMDAAVLEDTDKKFLRYYSVTNEKLSSPRRVRDRGELLVKPETT